MVQYAYSFLIMSNSLLLHLQICPRLVDGSPANWVSLAAIVPPLELVIDSKRIVAPKSFSVPSSNRCSPASSPRAAPLLPTFALRLTRRPSLTLCKGPKLDFGSLSAECGTMLSHQLSRMFQPTFGDSGSSSRPDAFSRGRTVALSESSVDHQAYDLVFYCIIQPSW